MSKHRGHLHPRHYTDMRFWPARMHDIMFCRHIIIQPHQFCLATGSRWQLFSVRQPGMGMKIAFIPACPLPVHFLLIISTVGKLHIGPDIVSDIFFYCISLIRDLKGKRNALSPGQPVNMLGKQADLDLPLSLTDPARNTAKRCVPARFPDLQHRRAAQLLLQTDLSFRVLHRNKYKKSILFIQCVRHAQLFTGRRNLKRSCLPASCCTTDLKFQYSLHILFPQCLIQCSLRCFLCFIQCLFCGYTIDLYLVCCDL